MDLAKSEKMVEMAKKLNSNCNEYPSGCYPCDKAKEMMFDAWDLAGRPDNFVKFVSDKTGKSMIWIMKHYSAFIVEKCS